ncbi:putative sugar ABC transporter, sugar-binding protein [Methylococcus capsulatus str. Bath]|uniref:Putative sugar ABC transporter, sugar-binding protein n=2 Tax=Methylococcus capsulatus TaxID=414 RepID=Q606S4_METCA|nr:putative sugar ABC transporter, sugar-binding protein [Methylococcus capsulatus str. Bath]
MSLSFSPRNFRLTGMAMNFRLSLVILSSCLWLLNACQPGHDESLTFWAFGSEGEVAHELASEFERLNPDVRVEVQPIPWNAAHEKLLTAYAGGSLPDVFQLGNTWIAEFQALRALDDVTRRFGNTGQKGDYFEGALDATFVEGRMWAVPWYVDTRILFYRRDLLEAVGITSPPRRWDGWFEALSRFHERTGAFGLFLAIDAWEVPVVFAMQHGAALLKDGDRHGDFLHPGFRAAFDAYLGWFREKLAPAESSGQVANLYREFEQGYFAALITGPWNLGEFRRRLRDLDAAAWDTAPLPSFDDSYPGISLAGGGSLALAYASRHKDAAWRLIEFLTEPRQQVYLYRLTGDLPPGRTAWSDPALAGDRKARSFRSQMERIAPLPKIPEWERIASRIAACAERAVRGEVPPQAALEALNREVDRILEKRRWLLERGL